MPVLHSVFVNLLGHLNVKTTILGDVHHVLDVAGLFVFLPPLQRFQSICRLLRLERGRRNRIQLEPMPQHLLDINQHVAIDRLIHQIVKRVGL